MRKAVANLLGTMLFVGALLVLSLLIAVGWMSEEEEQRPEPSRK